MNVKDDVKSGVLCPCINMPHHCHAVLDFYYLVYVVTGAKYLPQLSMHKRIVVQHLKNNILSTSQREFFSL